MAQYKVLIKTSAAKEIKAISKKKDRQRIVRRIQQLGENPRPPGCQKLSGRERFRVRQGQYRIVYGIKDNDLIVYVVKVGHRKDVYRAF
ncbi:MAG: mRNA interferase RelE/StbE [Rhodothermales bacterium]